MRLALIQFNPTVGDIKANTRRIVDLFTAAREQGADLVVFPELAVSGYPPKDLLLQEGFLDAVRQGAEHIAAQVSRATLVVGAPWGSPERLTNSALVIENSTITHVYNKRLLPTYDVFDEDRYFVAGDAPLVISVAGLRVGLSICEDLWRGVDALHEARYQGRADPVEALIEAGARLIINPSGSPFVIGKGARQREIVRRHVSERGVALATVNQVGANDDLIFDGHAAVYLPTTTGPRLIAAGPGFEEATVLCDIPSDESQWESATAVDDPRVEAVKEQLLYGALVLGVRDYCQKIGMKKAVIGLSGGIDSALTCCLAVAALGPENVLGVAMPSRYSSDGSVTDAQLLARSLAIPFETVPIEHAHQAAESSLAEPVERLGLDPTPGVAEENIQARLRGLILMAFSNKAGSLLLTTGNKSEVAVGYCTLYGDMNGGLAVLSDVSKLDVYALSRWINANHERCSFKSPPIPDDSITKPPSAELRPNQRDQDTLPPYEVLDQIIERYVEHRQSPARIVKETGIDAAIVKRTVRMIDINEYKRKQMPVGLKLTRITFGPGRRHPIAQGYRPDLTLD